MLAGFQKGTSNVWLTWCLEGQFSEGTLSSQNLNSDYHTSAVCSADSSKQGHCTLLQLTTVPAVRLLQASSCVYIKQYYLSHLVCSGFYAAAMPALLPISAVNRLRRHALQARELMKVHNQSHTAILPIFI